MAGDSDRREKNQVPDGRRPQGEAGGPLRLRDWLVAQIESGRYAGLRWEDASKTLFRIPWKHAAKQDYRAQQDAALFRAWAVYKGKHHEGVDKEDPATWKTRLRCALNKSTDFCEVRGSSQLDCAHPYKVYRIVSDGAQGPVTKEFAPLEKKGLFRCQHVAPGEVSRLVHSTKQVGLESASEDKELPPQWVQKPRAALPPDPLADHRYQAQNTPLPWMASHLDDIGSPADCWLHVQLFYGAKLVSEATAYTAEGCHLCPRAATFSAESLLGWPRRVAQIHFPEPPPGAHVLWRLLSHLERGVLLWVVPEGVFAKRLCQGRVYWHGPLAPHRTQPNKLEREHTCQLLDTRRFLRELHAHMLDGCPEPEYKIRLCFGEEYPGPPGQPEERLIMAHVEPVFARELLLHAKHLKQEASSAQGPHLSQPEESLPPLIVPRVCPAQRATDITCTSAHTEPVAGESLTTQCPGQQGRWTSPPVATQQQVD